MSALTLSAEQLENLTGYKRQAEQLAELHRRGYSRAYRDRLGRVVLTRAHFDAVEAGAIVPARPKVRQRVTA
jgi:hypothetical protein